MTPDASRCREVLQWLDALIWEVDVETMRAAFVSQRAQPMLGHTASVWLAGQEALDCLFASGQDNRRDTAHRPRAVLLELRLPNVDGLEVSCALHANEPAHRIPVVVLISSCEGHSVLRSHDPGVKSCTVEPVVSQGSSRITSRLDPMWSLLRPAQGTAL